MSKKLNCIVAQSGGPTTVINSSLSGVIYAALQSSQIDTIYGSVNGVQGVLQNNLINLNEIFENDERAIETLKNTPAMYLGSCRYKLPSIEKDEFQYNIIFNVFKELNIGYFFYIGGNDSMDTVNKLSDYAEKIGYDIKIMGIPKTIDNDLYGTDHTPGFGSAAKYVATTMLEIAHDTYIYDMSSVTIVEIMGRNAGWLTAASALARNSYNESPDLIYLPEHSFCIIKFIQDVNELLKKKKNVIVAVSEGVKDEKGKYISASSSAVDQFGHAQLSGTGKSLENIIKKSIGCKVRSIELSVLQRSAMHVASLTDINEAFDVGAKAVEFALNGMSGRMVTIERVGNSPYGYNIGSILVQDVANKEKNVPLEWISEEGNDVKQELVDYMLPLIMGEPKINYVNGIPEYLPIKHLLSNRE